MARPTCSNICAGFKPNDSLRVALRPVGNSPIGPARAWMILHEEHCSGVQHTAGKLGMTSWHTIPLHSMHVQELVYPKSQSGKRIWFVQKNFIRKTDSYERIMHRVEIIREGSRLKRRWRKQPQSSRLVSAMLSQLQPRLNPEDTSIIDRRVIQIIILKIPSACND